MCESQPIAPPKSLERLLRRVKLPVPLYSSESAWNQSAVEAGVDPLNGERIQATLEMLIAEGEREKKDFNLFALNSDEYTVPIFAARRGSVRLRSYTGQEWATHDPPSSDEGDRLIIAGLPTPISEIRPSCPRGIGSDGHLVLYDFESEVEYDFWQATTKLNANGTSAGGGLVGCSILEAGAIARFKLSDLGAQITTQRRPLNSARASGVPLLAGLLLPEDLESVIPRELDQTARPMIRHALAFALPRLRCFAHNCSPDLQSDWIYPASKSETRNALHDSRALAAGERIRLTDELFFADGTRVAEESSEVPPITSIFFRTLREYGAYLVDASGSVAFYAEDVHTGNLNVTPDQLKWLIGRELAVGETSWEAVVHTLDDQLNFKLAEISGVRKQPVPFIVGSPSGVIGNVSVVDPAYPPDFFRTV
jgi:hypothetical protein